MAALGYFMLSHLLQIVMSPVGSGSRGHIP